MDIDIRTKPDPEVMAEVGRRLRALRDAMGLSQAEAAKEAGLDRTTVSRAERGDNPTLLTLVRLLRVYGRMDALDAFIPLAEVSPMAVIEKRQGADPASRRPAGASPDSKRRGEDTGGG